MMSRSRLFLVALVASLGASAATPLPAQVVVAGDDVSQVLAVRNLQAEANGTVTGVLVNKSEQAVSEVRLLIRHMFLWSRERKPKDPEDNPARAVYYELEAPIRGNGAVSFRYAPNPPLPARNDGRFNTIVQVVSFNAVTLPGEWAPPGPEPATEVAPAPELE